jgi:two-component system, NtrC family, sensor histidine kinase HydH
VLGLALARLVKERLLSRDAEVTMEFVQSIVRTDATARYFTSASDGVNPALEDTLRHFAEMPDVLRANVYSTDKRVIWSSDSRLVGRHFPQNDELVGALEGKLEYESGVVSKEEHKAAAHKFSESGVNYFVEIYVPVQDAAGKVVGVVELYKTPDALFAAIRDSERAVAVGAAGGALLLYVVLLGIVRRADRIMRDQQRRLLEGERLATVGEMAAAIAHAIRNPLSAIRTSVEVALDREPEAFREPAEDIIAKVDKVEEWVRELLAFSRPGSVRRVALDLEAIARKSMTACQRDIERLGVRLETAFVQPAPVASGDPIVVEQVLVSLITNALDAMPRGGTLTLSTGPHARGAEIRVQDTGEGIAAEDLAFVFVPFFTSKARGVGLGLPLAKRMVERMGGSLEIESRVGVGTTAHVRLAA